MSYFSHEQLSPGINYFAYTLFIYTSTSSKLLLFTQINQKISRTYFEIIDYILH